jgi:hypothetical protein
MMCWLEGKMLKLVLRVVLTVPWGRLVEEDASELGVREVAPDSPPGDAHDESMISMVVPSSYVTKMPSESPGATARRGARSLPEDEEGHRHLGLGWVERERCVRVEVSSRER